MQIHRHAWLLECESVFEEFPEKRVIPEPFMSPAKGDDESIGGCESLQNRLTVGPPGQHGGQRTTDPLQQARLEQEVPIRDRKPVQNLTDQIVRHRSLIARESLDARGEIVGIEEHGGQPNRRRPALGPAVEHVELPGRTD